MKKFLSRNAAMALLVAGGVLAGMVVIANLRMMMNPTPPARRVGPSENKASTPLPKVNVWAEKIAPRLKDVEKQGVQSVDRYLERIRGFFEDRKQGTKEFSENVLGWSGKWAFVQEKLFGESNRSHRDFLRQEFDRTIFTERELKEWIENTVSGFISHLEGQENDLLVKIRMDISENDLPTLQALSSLRSDEVFRGEFRKVLKEVIPIVARDLNVTIGREAAVFVGSEIATIVTMKIAQAVAIRLGVSSGILGTGAASGVATFGVGLALGFVVDGVADWAMKQAGYNPTEEISRQTRATLDRIESLLIAGDVNAHQEHARLRNLEKTSTDERTRQMAKQSADRIGNDGSLGLRYELTRISQVRSLLRERALKKILVAVNGR